jgi:hypothetical protein
METDDPENSTGLGKAALEDALEIWNLACPPGFKILPAKVAHLDEHIHRGYDIRVREYPCYGADDPGIILVLFITVYRDVHDCCCYWPPPCLF